MEPERPRVALIAGTLGHGGAEKQLAYGARALAAAGVDVLVLSLTRGERYERTLCEAGIPVVFTGRAPDVPRRLLAIARETARFRPQIVQSCHTFANLYAALAARRAGALSLGALRSSVAHAREGNGAWTPWLLRAPSALVVNSRAADARLRADPRLCPRNVYVVPNVIDAGPCRPDPRRSGHPFRAVLVGRLIAAKRVDRFLDALASARREVPDLCGVVVGDGPERGRLERRAAELGLGRAVEFLGLREDVPEILAAADVLVLSSDDEGFPNVLLEAMEASRPVVATDVGDVRDVVCESETGFVVPPDAGALAARLVEIAANPALTQTMGAAGRARVESRFGLAALGEALLDVYRDLARKEDHARAAAAFA